MSGSLDKLVCNNAPYVEAMLQEFVRDPQAVPVEWREYFQQLSGEQRMPGVQLGPSFRPRSLYRAAGENGNGRASSLPRDLRGLVLQERVDQLVRAYRVRGHLIAQLDPLGFQRREPPELTHQWHGLTDADLDRLYSTTSIGGPATQTLRQILERLRSTYCRYIGAQFMHIDDLSVREWLQQRMEESENRLQISRTEQLRILTRLTDATIFEQFVRKKYVGAKTFSLEGAESLIPLLDLAIERAAEHGVREIVMAMAHRGRLNVLANILNKRPQEIFWEFEDPHPERHLGRGDVKYHLGFSSDWTTTAGRTVHLSLCFNPSHLEYVNPVALGRMRAKQDRVNDWKRQRGMVLMVHGDAAFAGEGIVQETLNLSQLHGYRVGGALHVIVNNQLGFTTSPPEGRSSPYATDVAKLLQVPIFHVNGEDPEAVAQVVRMAMDFRHVFHRDVIIDMYCYRRWGHNEGDDPSFTQPLLYRQIEQRESVRDRYLEHLLQLGGIERPEAERIAEQRYQHLEHEFQLAKSGDFVKRPQTLSGFWDGYQGGPHPSQAVLTGVAKQQLTSLLQQLTHVPDDFHLHRKLARQFERRREMAAGQEPLDWSAAEALAIASLAVEGHRVRISGQDAQRGTFSHRHAALHDVEDGRIYLPFQHLDPQQAVVEIYNSPLSEAGVLGFEYGFSLDYPEALVVWEAQFGDFWNAAQVIVDQFIASAEDKWYRLSGLVALLPHGFEGQGPEHSSARLERLLLLGAEDNLQVVYPSTPAQLFHCLRRQALRRWRKPLFVLTPKSMLRHPQVVSSLDDLENGSFQRVLADAEHRPGNSIRRILLCTGKIYYDLCDARQQRGAHDVAILRIEELYPLPRAILETALDQFSSETPVFWVQEEPANMGAWQCMKVNFGDRLFGRFPFFRVSRPPSASPATGSAAGHKLEQEQLMKVAFEGNWEDETEHLWLSK